MTAKVRSAAREGVKDIEMIIPKQEKITVKSNLERELAQLRGYEVPNSLNQRGWQDHRDSNEP